MSQPGKNGKAITREELHARLLERVMSGVTLRLDMSPQERFDAQLAACLDQIHNQAVMLGQQGSQLQEAMQLIFHVANQRHGITTSVKGRMLRHAASDGVVQAVQLAAQYAQRVVELQKQAKRQKPETESD